MFGASLFVRRSFPPDQGEHSAVHRPFRRQCVGWHVPFFVAVWPWAGRDNSKVEKQKAEKMAEIHVKWTASHLQSW